MVENGANLNALTITQATPLMRAVESASADVVEYLLEQPSVKLTLENMQGDTVMDVAKQFADPRVYQLVRKKFDSLPKPKDNKKKQKSKAKKKNEKKKGEVIVYKDNFLPPINMRPASHAKAEEFLAQSVQEKEHILFRPVHSWTEQDTTEDLLKKKQYYREKYGWEFDFEDYKIPMIKNVTNRLKTIET